MRVSSQTPRRYRAFTLIELLVVVTIIAVLVGMFFPILGAVTNKGRQTQAVSDQKGLMTAIFAYMGDYNNKLPAYQAQIDGAKTDNGTGSGYDTVFGDGKNALYPNYLIMNVLRAREDDSASNDNSSNNNTPKEVLNPTKTLYLDEPYAKNQTEPRSGILRIKYFDGTYDIKPGAFVDPWGSEYLIWLDVCRDRNLNDGMIWFYPNFPKDTDPSKPKYGPFGSVQIGSLGADGNFGKNGVVAGSDDILLVQ